MKDSYPVFKRLRHGMPEKTLVACVIVAAVLLVTGACLAGDGDGEEKLDTRFPYDAYTEAQINAALLKPVTLEECIRIALAGNISLRVVRSDHDMADATHAGAYGIFYPTLSIEGMRENTREQRLPESAEVFENQQITGTVEQLLPTGMMLGFTTDLSRDVNSVDRFGASPTRTRNRKFLASVRQPLLRGAWPTVVRSTIKTAEYDRDMLDQQLYATKLQTVYEVKQSFYEVLMQRELIKINQAAITRDSTLLNASKSMVESQIATRRDVLSAEIQLADDRATLIKSQTDYQLALDQLKNVMGIPIETPVAIAFTELSTAETPLQEQRLIRSALENNPNLKSLAIDVNRSRLQVKVAKNSLLPQLDLVGSYSGNLESDTDQGIDLRTRGLALSFNLSYPFMNRDASAKAEVAQIEVAQKNDLASDLRRRIIIDVRSIVRTTYSSIQEIKALQQSIEAAREKVEFANTMYNLGRASNLDITDAQEALLKAETKHIQKLVEYYVLLALLESITGHYPGQ